MKIDEIKNKNFEITYITRQDAVNCLSLIWEHSTLGWGCDNAFIGCSKEGNILGVFIGRTGENQCDHFIAKSGNLIPELNEVNFHWEAGFTASQVFQGRMYSYILYKDLRGWQDFMEETTSDLNISHEYAELFYSGKLVPPDLPWE